MEQINFKIENFNENILLVYKGAFKKIINKIVKIKTYKFQRIAEIELEELKLKKS
jgi:hypothetical protein